MFGTILSISYYCVAFFYLACGVLLLTHPRFMERYLKALFPVLASFRYALITNALNLVFVGSILLILGKLMYGSLLLGYFMALILSGLEVYLGVAFYYFEERNIPQALIHFLLHLILVIAVGILILKTFSLELRTAQEQAATFILNL